VKVALGGLLVYLVSPLDLIPELLPVIGSFDDVIIAGRSSGSEARPKVSLAAPGQPMAGR
jgi:hypothetical protein